MTFDSIVCRKSSENDNKMHDDSINTEISLQSQLNGINEYNTFNCMS